MREKILAGIRDVNPWMFTAIAVLFAMILTTGLNSFFAWLDGGKFNPKIFMYATIDAILIPLIIAPIMINAFKRVIKLERANQQLQGQIEQHQRAQQVAEERVANLQTISDFALACAAAAPEADLPKLIAEKLQAITGALGVAISEYDAREQALITRHLTVSGATLSALNNLLGRNVIGLRSPASPAALQWMLNEVVSAASDLNEVSFGAIPKPVSALIQKTFGIGAFTGLAFIYGGELWGAAMIVMRKGQAPIDQELGLALANVAALAMRRQKTEVALRASEERYRLISTVSSDYMFSARLNEQGQIMLDWVAGAFESITGYTLDEYVALGGWFATLHPEDVDKVTQDMSALEENRPAVTEARLRTKSGEARWVRFYAHPIWEAEKNRLTGIYGAVQDISAQKEAEAREVYRRETLEKMVRLGMRIAMTSSVRDCLLEVRQSILDLGFDRAGIFLYDAAAKQVRGTVGTDRQGNLEDISDDVQEVVEGGEWHSALESPFNTLLVENLAESYHYARAGARMKGVRQHLMVSAWAGEMPAALIAIDNLLTQRPILMEQVDAMQLFAGYIGLAIQNARWSENLSQRVEERTAELETLNRELESLSYTIGHDLRSPIRAIAAHTHLLMENSCGRLLEDECDKLQLVNRESLRMGSMVDEFLAFLRLGRTVLRRRSIHVADLVGRVITDLQAKSGSENVEFLVQPMPDCVADAGRMYDVYHQLIANAIKFSKQCRPARIEIGAVEKQGETCYFVRDNGVGFEMKYADKLFGVFQRLHHEDEFEGVGIGLAIAQRILQRHGGRIWAEAEPDKGATFYFTLE